MKSMIIGGGSIGYFLLKTLTERGYSVVLIERDENVCRKIAEDITADVICGDGTDVDVLRDAGIEDAEVVAAVTGEDEENLVICKIAKINFNVNKTIAKVNNPKNMTMFKALGVDKTVCSTEVIARLIQYEFDKDDFKIVQVLERGSMLLVERTIDENSPWLNYFVKDLKLPAECVIASILRDEKVIFPRGSTQIKNNDDIFLITNKNALAELKSNSGSKGVNGGIFHAR